MPNSPCTQKAEKEDSDFEDKLIIEQDPISTYTQRQRCPYHPAGLYHLCQEHSKNPSSPPASPRQAPPTSHSPCSNHSGTNCFTVGFSAGRQCASELNDTAQLKIAGENKTLNKCHWLPFRFITFQSKNILWSHQQKLGKCSPRSHDWGSACFWDELLRTLSRKDHELKSNLG